MHLGDILDIIVGDIEGDLGSNSGWGVGDWGVEEEESGVDDIRIDDMTANRQNVFHFLCFYCCESYFDFYSS